MWIRPAARRAAARRRTRLTRGLAAAGILVALVLASPACSPARGPSARRPRSLLLIVIDTLRNDRLGCAGYAKAITPTLDSLAASGTRFADAMTAVPVTLPSFSTILTGRWPFHHGVRDNDRFVLAGSEETLAERFKAGGWRTGAVLASAVLTADRGLSQGFDTYDDHFGGDYPVYDSSLTPLAQDLGKTRRRANVVTDRALDLARSFGDDPFFLMVHYFDPHMFYDAPPEYRALHPDDPYDAEITFADHEIGRLLRDLPHREDVLVVVAADHGESNGEHGEPQHGFLVYQSTLHVPIIASGPGVPAGLVRRDPVSLVDVEPTLGRIFRLPGGKGRDGRALRWASPERGDRVLYAETLRPLISYGWREERAVRRGRWKMITGPPVELYDLDADPGERSDRGDGEPAPQLQRALSHLIGKDDAEAVYRKSRGIVDPDRLNALAGLGYMEGAAADISPANRPNPRDTLPHWVDEQKAKALVREASVNIDAKEWRRSVDLLTRALALNPDLADAWYLRGSARAEIRDFKASRADYEKCLALQPKHVQALTGLAALEDAEGHNLEERRLLEKAVRLAPESAPLHLKLGVVSSRLGDARETRENLETYLRLAPDDPHADQVRDYLESEGEPGH